MSKETDSVAMVSAARKNGQARWGDGNEIAPRDCSSTARPQSNTAQDSSTERATALLTGVAEAARRLLAIDDFDTAVNKALEAIASSASIDRIYIFENHVELATRREFADCPYEWTATGVAAMREIPKQYPFFYEDVGFENWLSELKQGRTVQKLTRELSALGQAKQEKEGRVLSLLTVPIFVEGEYWGLVGFDDCTTERVWEAAEIAALETAAATFAAALQRRGSVATLRSRDELLDSVNAAAQCLVANENLAEAVPEALRILGEGTGQDRVYVFENAYPRELDELFWALAYEWNSPKGTPIANIADQFPFPASAFPEELVSLPLERGEATQFLTRELEGVAAEANEDVLTQSSIVVPISVNGAYWGSVGFDDCTTERVWSESEIAVLETAAACIGSAIERDRTQKARMDEIEAHNQALEERDRILQATAEAANGLLAGTDFELSVNQSLEIIGQGLDTDRVAILEYIESTADGSTGYVETVYEWNSVHVAMPQSEHPDLIRQSVEGAEDIIQLLEAGQSFGGLIDEVPLPETIKQPLKESGAQSTYSIPILIEGDLWGAVGIDDCRVARQRSEAELSILKTTAACLGDAIQQERDRQSRIAEVQAHNQALAERDRILEATAAAANVMLTEGDFDTAVNKALKIIGEGLDVDRVGLMKHFATSDGCSSYHQEIYECVKEGLHRQMDHPELFRISDSGIEFVVEKLVRGEVFGGVAREMPEPFRSGQQELGVLSTYAIPILVSDCYWGIIALDDCHNETRRSEAELEALMTLANCIGSAIEQEQVKQARIAESEAHNQALAERDRILEATAVAANVMLTDDDFDSAVNRALQIVGEGLEVDRVSLWQYFDAPVPQGNAYTEGLYEWTAEDIPVQIEHPELARISDEGVEFIIETLRAGRIFGGVVEELPEPFRSIQLKAQVKSIYNVPFFVSNSFWGFISFDDCHKLTRRSEAELEALRTLANCIGSAIEQDLTQKAREAAERRAIIEQERASSC